MLNLLRIELANRRIHYLLFICGVTLMGFFVDFALVISLAFLAMIRVTQILNQREYAEGTLGFYFILPVPRSGIVLSKIIGFTSVLFVSSIFLAAANTISSNLGFTLYNENIEGIAADLTVWLSFSIGIIVTVNILRFYLVKSVKDMMNNIKYMVFLILLLMVVFYTQILKGETGLVEVFIPLFDSYKILFWALSTAVVCVLYFVTIFQLKKKDIDYV